MTQRDEGVFSTPASDQGRPKSPGKTTEYVRRKSPISYVNIVSLSRCLMPTRKNIKVDVQLRPKCRIMFGCLSLSGSKMANDYSFVKHNPTTFMGMTSERSVFEDRTVSCTHQYTYRLHIG